MNKSMSGAIAAMLLVTSTAWSAASEEAVRDTQRDSANQSAVSEPMSDWSQPLVSDPPRRDGEPG